MDEEPLGFTIREARGTRTAGSRRGNRISLNRKSERLPARIARFDSAQSFSYGEHNFSATLANGRLVFGIAQGG